MLLGISALSLFIAKTKLVPSKISALGIDFEQADQQAFLQMMAFVVIYFVIAFILYGLTDFLSWRLSYNESIKAVYKEVFDEILEKPKSINDSSTSYPKDWVSKWPNNLAMPASVARAMFEFLLPVLVGIYAIYNLISAANQIS